MAKPSADRQQKKKGNVPQGLSLTFTLNMIILKISQDASVTTGDLCHAT